MSPLLTLSSFLAYFRPTPHVCLTPSPLTSSSLTPSPPPSPAGRPTEIPETDVYICENLFDESKRQIVSRGGDMKRYSHTEAVLQDEVYQFRRLLVLRKQPLAVIQQEANERIKSLFAEAVGVRLVVVCVVGIVRI